MLRALKKKHYKTNISFSVIRSNNGTYWKSARVLRKHNFNHTNVIHVQDVNGDIQIVNLFKDTYERLFSSVQCSKEESDLMKTQIDSEVVNVDLQYN